MFLLESLHFRKTEPRFFSILRLSIAFVFSCVLVFYVWSSLRELVSDVNSKNPAKITYPEFKICPRTSSDYDNNSTLRISLYKLYYNDSDSHAYIPNNYSFYDKNNKYKSMTKFYPNMLNNLQSNSSNNDHLTNDNNDNHCMKFTPVDEYLGRIADDGLTLPNELLFIITMDNSSIYDYFEISFESFIFAKVTSENETKKLGSNLYFITSGQYHVYKFYYKNTKFYSSPFSGFLGFDADQNNMEIVIEDILLQTPNAFNTALELSWKYDFIVDDDIMMFKNDVRKLFESFGGFYSFISGTFVLLFGASKLSPWGICQTHLLRCWPFRRRFKKYLANRYVSRAGIPLAEDPRKLPENSRIEDRVAILEILLKEYYIDGYYLDELRKTRKKYLNTRKSEDLELLGDDNGSDFHSIRIE